MNPELERILAGHPVPFFISSGRLPPQVVSLATKNKLAVSKRPHDVSVFDARTREKIQVTSPCSLGVQDETEVEDIAYAINQIGEAICDLSKKDFRIPPRIACSSITRNLVINSLIYGFSNATHVWSKEGCHSYALFPWVSPNDKGVILCDPTAGQISNNRYVEVYTTIKYGVRWSYEKDSRQGGIFRGDMYPDLFTHLWTYLRSIERECEQRERWKPPEAFFEAAFANPVNPPNLAELQKSLKMVARPT